MADDDVRRAERAWRASGSSEDEAQCLRERVRSGSLATVRLDLAAYVGHPPARLVIATADVPDLGPWARGLGRFGHLVLVRAAHAAAASVLPLWTGRPDPTQRHLGEGAPDEQLAAVEAVLACPCDQHVAEAHELANGIIGSDAVQKYGSTPSSCAHDAADNLAYSIRLESTGHDFSCDAILLASLARGYDLTGVREAPRVTNTDESRAAFAAVWDRAMDAGQPAIRAAIREALVAWALA